MNHYDEWDELLDAIDNPDALAEEAEQAFYDARFAAIVLGEVMEPIVEAFRELTRTINDAWRGFQEKLRPALDKIADIFANLPDPPPVAPKKKPRKPPRTVTANVAYTRTKPPKPTVIYRRRTP